MRQPRAQAGNATAADRPWENVSCWRSAGAGLLGGKLLVAWRVGAAALFPKAMRAAHCNRVWRAAFFGLRVFAARARGAGYRGYFAPKNKSRIVEICRRLGQRAINQWRLTATPAIIPAPGPGLRSNRPACSRPMDNRKRPSGEVVPAPSIDARCSIKLSTPPRLVARVKIFVFAATRIAASRPLSLQTKAFRQTSTSVLQQSRVRDATSSRDNARAQTFRCWARNSATFTAFSECARIRQGSVRIPRRISQQSKGEGTAPPSY